jgi:peroxiredoxin
MKNGLMVLLLMLSLCAFSQNNVKVKKGKQAIDFQLDLISGDEVELSKLYTQNNVVLVVLRGWPEYQCPACSRQVGQYLAEEETFKELNAEVLLVYPGPSKVLQEKAKEFASDFSFPSNFHFALDPNYSMVNAYGLRWDAPQETAYPSTFVINKKGKVVYAKISSTHGGRANVEEILKALKKL